MHLRIDDINTEEDVLIEGFIRAAAEWIENYCRVSLLETRWQMRLDRFPDGGEPIELPIRPLIVRKAGPIDSSYPLIYVSGKKGDPLAYLKTGTNSYLQWEKTASLAAMASPIVSMFGMRDDGQETHNFILPEDNFFLAFDGNPPTVTMGYGGWFWPMTTTFRSYTAMIEWTAGYSINSTGIPHALKTAVKLFAAHLYLNREGTSASAGMPMPFGIAALIAPFESGELV